MATRDELVVAVAGRYAMGSRAERGRILDEFVAVTGHHRKHATRLLRVGLSTGSSGPRPDRRVYNEAMREALIVIWEASDRICGKRLRRLLPILIEAVERHGHLQLAAEVRIGLLAMSAATIDCALSEGRGRTGGRRRRAAPSAAVRRSVAVRTFDGWEDPPLGLIEADLVAHSGPTAKGACRLPNRATRRHAGRHRAPDPPPASSRSAWSSQPAISAAMCCSATFIRP